MRKTQHINQVALAKMLNVSRVTLLAWRKQGFVPPPIAETRNQIIWEINVINAWIKAIQRMEITSSEI